MEVLRNDHRDQNRNQIKSKKNEKPWKKVQNDEKNHSRVLGLALRHDGK